MSEQDTGALPSMQNDRESVAERIYVVLRDHQVTNMAWDDDTPGFPLVDLVSNPAPADISSGEEQLRILAGEIAFALARTGHKS